MCSEFDLVDNYIKKGYLKKNFRLAGVPHYKTPMMTPLEHLHEILKDHFEASMLKTPFSVQVTLFVTK
jgi:hypothetical protein